MKARLPASAVLLACVVTNAWAAPPQGPFDPGAWQRWTTHVVAEPGGFPGRADSLRFGPDETAACLQCHGAGALLVRDSTRGAVRSLAVSGPAYAASAHGAVACTQCHPDVRAYPHTFDGDRPQVGCDADCHARDAHGRTIRHDAAVAAQRASAHAAGLEGRASASPACTGCHGGGDAHRVERVGRGFTPAERLERCAPCHDDAAAMRAARVDGGAVRDYRSGFHYAAIVHGDARGAVCEDCHGAHDVRAASDSTSRTAPAHLATTCGRAGCHPGATAAFARSGADHPGRRVAEHAPLAAVDRAFRAFGLGVLAILALGTLLDLQWRLRRARPAPRAGDAALVERLPRGQRLLHGALMLAFTLLATTGATIRWPDSAWAIASARAFGGANAVGGLHRVGAALLLAAAVAHVAMALRLLARAHGGPARAWSLWPTLQDARDALGTIAHQMGLRKDAPAAGRRTWQGKLHYAAVAVGTIAMSVTGGALLHPQLSSRLLPEAGLALMRRMHGEEAVVAVGITLVWHVYHVHVAPWPNARFRTWLDGRVTRAWWRVERPLEAAAVEARPIASPARGGGSE